MTTIQESIHKSKLRALAQGVKVLVLEPGLRYAVPSSSRDGAAYDIKVEITGDLTCNCPSGQYRGYCVHIGAVMVRMDVEATATKAESPRNEELEAQIAELYH
jgi:hypothetical protein